MSTHITLDTAPDMLTISDLMSVLQIGKSTAYKLISLGQITCKRIGRSIRIPKQFVIDYIEKSII